jgi:hypothetical protein
MDRTIFIDDVSVEEFFGFKLYARMITLGAVETNGEAVVAYFKQQPQHSPGGTEKKH